MPAAAAAGAGIAPAPLFAVAPRVARGELERVLQEWQLPSGHLSLLWPAARATSPRSRAFLEYLAEHWGTGTARGL